MLTGEIWNLQTEDISRTLRTGLWNIVYSRLFGQLSANSFGLITQDHHLFIQLWRHFFRLPMDEFDKQLADRRATFRDFFEVMPPGTVFGFFEFVAAKMTAYESKGWVTETNEILEREHSAYRFVGVVILPIAPAGALDFDHQIKGCNGLLVRQQLIEFYGKWQDLLRQLSPAQPFTGVEEILNEEERTLKSAADKSAAQKGVEKEDFNLKNLAFTDFLIPFFSFVGELLQTEGGHSAEVGQSADVRHLFEQILSMTSLGIPIRIQENLRSDLELLIASSDSGQLGAAPQNKGSAEALFLIGRLAAMVTLILQKMAESGFLELKPDKEAFSPVQDPWGERRLGRS